MKLSIIVPIYNVEIYLRECLNSILNSSFSDWECILVDDGSPDNSGSICDEYVRLDRRFKVIHKLNGGLSSARNAGLDVAKGEWIGFVDSDDFVSKTLFENLLAPVLQDNSIDIVLGGCTNFIDGKIGTIEQHYQTKVTTDIPYILNNYRGLIASKLVKRSIIENKCLGEPLRFDINSKIEDTIFTLSYLRFVKKALFINESGYYYRRDNPLSLTKIINVWTYSNKYYDWKATVNYIYEICEDNNINPHGLDKRRNVLSNFLKSVLTSLYSSGLNKQERIIHLKNDFTLKDYSFLQYSNNDKELMSIRYRYLMSSNYCVFDFMSCLHRNVTRLKCNVKFALSKWKVLS